MRLSAHTLEQFAMDRLAEVKANTPEAIARIHILSFGGTTKTGIAFGKRGVTENLPVQVNLSDGQGINWNLVSIDERISELRETRLFLWGIGASHRFR